MIASVTRPRARAHVGIERPLRLLGAAALIALPGALAVYLGFNAGGFFPFATGLVAALLAVLIALRVLIADDPFAGLTAPLIAVIGAAALYSAWTLVSATWSHAPARALVEFDRALLYLLVLAACACFPRTPSRTRWLVRSLAAGAFVVCSAGLVSRVLPHVWPVRPTVHPERLSFPLTYWNTLGLLAIVALLLCFYMATSEREPRPLRVAAAAAVPLLASTALFTYSRGALAVGAVGLVVYIVLGRTRGMVAGTLATAPATALALVATYGADKLSSTHPTSAAAVSQGHHVALVLALSALLAAGLRGALLPVDGWLARRPRRRHSPRRLALAGSALVALVLAVSLTLGAPSSIGKQYQRFVSGADIGYNASVHARLTNPSNNERLKLWRVALRGYHASPFHGAGAGTFENLWYTYRPYGVNVTEGHSLYAETLGELGIVGIVLLGGLVLGGLAGIASRIRGPDRALYAVLLAAALAWALHAAFDWDWEMPVVTMFFFFAAGAALARAPGGPARLPMRSTTMRVAIAIGMLVVAVTPASVAVSQARIDSAAAALNRGDCQAAIGSALSANSAVGSRPEPFEIMAFCDVRLGRDDLALRAMSNAVRFDPRNWKVHYGMALVEAASGQDPRAEALRASRLDPLDSLTIATVRRFSAHNRAHWRALALSSPVVLN